MAERLEFFTPVVGRFVSGSITEKRTKDNDNRDIPADDQRFEFGVAFDKAAIWPMLVEQWYPYLANQLARDTNGLQRLQGWFTSLTGFSMKVADGDKPNSKGVVNEHTKGCFVIYVSSSFQPKTVGPDAAFTEISADVVKRGYYVQIAGNISPNNQPGDRAGIYVNCNVVRLIAEGDEIRGGVDAATAFGGTQAPAVLPPGARPLGSASGGAAAFGGAPGLPQTGAPAPIGTAPVGLPGLPAAAGAPVSTASHINPHTGILNGPPGLPPR